MLKARDESRDRVLGPRGWRCGWISLTAKVLGASSGIARLLHEKYAPKIRDLVRPTQKSRSNRAVSWDLISGWLLKPPTKASYREISIPSRTLDDDISDREIRWELQPKREENTCQSRGNAGSVQVSKASVSCFPHVVSDDNHLW